MPPLSQACAAQHCAGWTWAAGRGRACVPVCVSAGPSVAKLGPVKGASLARALGHPWPPWPSSWGHRGVVEMGSSGQGQQDLWSVLNHMLVCVPVCWYAVCVNKYVYVSLYRCERKRESAQKKEAESAVQRLFVFLKIDETPEKFPPTLPLNQQLSGWQGKPVHEALFLTCRNQELPSPMRRPSKKVLLPASG